MGGPPRVSGTNSGPDGPEAERAEGRGDPVLTSERATRRKRWIRTVQIALSIVVVVAIFALILPKIASYPSVWQTITSRT